MQGIENAARTSQTVARIAALHCERWVMKTRIDAWRCLKDAMGRD